jgi:hypothetical protein
MLLMSKDLEARIAEPTEKDNSMLFFGDEKFPCSLLKTETNFDENKKILRIKVPTKVMDYIYSDKVPTGLNYRSGKKIQFDPIHKIVCEKTETMVGLAIVLTVEVAL